MKGKKLLWLHPISVLKIIKGIKWMHENWTQIFTAALGETRGKSDMITKRKLDALYIFTNIWRKEKETFKPKC